MALLKRFWVITLLLVAVIPASAQFKFGPRLGVAVNGLHFNETMFSKDNRAGFTGGLQFEFTVPVIGVGGDLSAMYVHRSTTLNSSSQNYSTDVKTNYIEIPLNFKYKVNIPAISRIFAPYIFTGPSFAFLLSKNIIDDFKAKKCDIAWNFGFGVELIRHLQLGASYGLGLTKALETVGVLDNGAGIEGKNRYWTITAAWLF